MMTEAADYSKLSSRGDHMMMTTRMRKGANETSWSDDDDSQTKSRLHGTYCWSWDKG